MPFRNTLQPNLHDGPTRRLPIRIRHRRSGQPVSGAAAWLQRILHGGRPGGPVSLKKKTGADEGQSGSNAQYTSGPNHEVLTQMPNASVGRQVESPILPTEFPSALQLPFHQDQPFLGPSWKEEAHPINPTQSLAIGQHVKLSGNTACAPSNLDPSANFQFVSGAVVKEDRSGASGQKR